MKQTLMTKIEGAVIGAGKQLPEPVREQLADMPLRYLDMVVRILDLVMTRRLTDNQIIEIRERLIAVSGQRALTVIEQNIRRDCDIALVIVRSSREARIEAAERVTDYLYKGLVP